MRNAYKSILTGVMAAALLFTSGVSFALPAYPKNPLMLGDSSDDVASLQSELKSIGLYSGEITGLYDENTQSAVKALQTAVGISPDGQFGAVTYEAYAKLLIQQPLIPIDAASFGSVSNHILEGKIIGLDPGHQATADITLERISPVKDLFKFRMSAGTSGVKTGTSESLINLLIALKLKDMLNGAGAQVIMTRTEQDVNVSNAERALVMNNAGVDFWIRFHCDNSSDAKLTGASVLIPAATETPDIYEESHTLGVYVLDAFCASTAAKNLSIVSISNQTGYNWSKNPVITIEMGYLSNPCDDVRLNRDTYQRACAKGIFDGILAYYTTNISVDNDA